MMDKKISIVLVTCVLLVAGIVWANATKTPISGTMYHTGGGGGPPDWVDDELIGHWRDVEVTFDVEGDLMGTLTVMANSNVDLKTFNGDEFGSFELDVTYGELQGTFKGRMSGTMEHGVSTSSFVGHGSGDFDGMKLRLTITFDWRNPATYEGTILDPHDE
jgi:hypothetical protein